jgi:drug/metabolite transporter (DMT)-like permease
LNHTRLSHWSLLLVAVFYGAGFSIAKMVMSGYLESSGFILLRIGISAILFVIFHALFIRQKLENRKDYLYLLIASVFGVAANMLLFFKGLSLTTPMNASVLMLNTPVFVMVFSLLIYKEKLYWQQILGLVLALTGAFFLISGLHFHFHTETALGDLYIIINATSYAFYLVYVRKLLARYHSITVVKYLFVMGTFLVLPFGYSELQTASFSTFPSHIWWAIGFVVIGTTFIAYLFNAWALQKTSSAIVGSYIYIQPVVATIISIWMGQDKLSVEKVIFALVVCAGVYLVSFSKKER